MVARLSRTVVIFGLLLAAVPVRAAEVSKYLPNDSEIVVTINVKQILDSPLVQKHALEKAKAALQANDEARKVLDALGLDPFKDIATVTVAVPGQKEKPEQAALVVQGRFDARKIEATAAEAAKTDAGKITIHKIGDDKVYEVQQQDEKKPLFATLIDAGTILAASSKDYIAEALDKRGGKKQFQVKKELQELLDKSDGKQSVSIVVLGSAVNGIDALQNEPLIRKVLNLTGGITISDSLKLDFLIATKDAEAAAEINKKITAGLGFVALLAAQDPNNAVLADIVSTIKVQPDGSAVSIKMLVKNDVIEKAIKKAGGE